MDTVYADDVCEVYRADGGLRVRVSGQDRPGVYDTVVTARFAARFPTEVLVSLQAEHEQITRIDLLEKCKELPIAIVSFLLT